MTPPEKWLDTNQQRCWVHKTANILNCLPKNLHAQAKSDIQQIWMAETKTKAYKAFNEFIEKYKLKTTRPNKNTWDREKSGFVTLQNA